MTKRRRGSYVLAQQERDGQSAIRHACWSLTFALRLREGSDAEGAVQHVREALAAAMVELETLPQSIRPSPEELEQQRRRRDEARAEQAVDREHLHPGCVRTCKASMNTAPCKEEQA